MPVLMACPNPKCNHPGPLGFSEGGPWGMHFYHGRECPGMWLYNDKWYPDQKEAWKAYKKDNPGKPENWVKAFDRLLLHNDRRGYDRYIAKWGEDVESGRA